MRTTFKICVISIAAISLLAGCSSSGGVADAGPGAGGGVAGTGGGTAGTGGGVAAAGGGAGGGSTGVGGGSGAAFFPKPHHSSSIAITTDDTAVVAVNQDNDTMSIFNTTNNLKTNSVAFPGGNQMPVSVAIHPDNLTAFVVLRKAQKLVKVTNLTANLPVVGTSVSVGSEPTNVSLSPTGKYAVVTNYGDNTISIVNTTTMVATTVVVGPNPRAVAITNDLDDVDEDETAYVTLFFGAAVAEASDTGRIGKVIPVPLSTGVAGAAINLNPIADTGFGVLQPDGGFGTTVGCAPNQLYNIAINGTKAYVVHVCASPRGPVSPTANLFAGVSVINLAATPPVEDTGLAGTFALSKLLRAQEGAVASNLLGVPIDIDFKAGTADVAYVLSQAGDVVQRIQYLATGPVLGSGGFAQIDTRAATGTKVGTGLVTSYGGTNAKLFTNNWVDRSVTVITLANQAVAAVIPSETKPMAGSAAAAELRGKLFYFTGTGRWALRSVNSCASCHPDGISDNLTWIFAAGPRQTIGMDSTFSKVTPFEMRALNWTAIFDEIHDFELNTRGTAGGKGALTVGTVPNDVRIAIDIASNPDGGITEQGRQDFLSGSTKVVTDFQAVVKDWNEIDAFSRKIVSNRAPTGLVAADVTAGRALFANGGCDKCHGGPNWTISRVSFTPSLSKNGTVATVSDAGVPIAANGLRTQPVDGGSLDFASATINRDTLKVAVETGVTIEDGGIGNVGPERITCVLRDVGTFKVASDRKADGTMGQGAKGFNPPSLLGLATSAPYLHDGSKATLEDLLGDTNVTHLRAGNANFSLDSTELRQMVAFLKSIDNSTAPLTVPAPAGGKTFDICTGY